MRPAAPVAVFAAVTLVAFWKVLFLGWTLVDVRRYESLLGRARRDPPGWFERHRPPVRRDDTLLLLPGPLRIYSEGVKAGELRLWSPLLFCGYPLTSDPILQPFYPPNLILHRFLDPLRAYDVSLALHFFASGLAMFTLLRGLGRSRPAAVAGGLFWMLGGYNTLWVSAGFLAGVTVFGPLAMLGLARASKGCATASALGGAAMGGAILGSHPQHALFLFAFLAAWIVAGARRGGVIRNGGLFVLFAVGVGFPAIRAHLDTVAYGFRVSGGDLDLIYDRPWCLPAYLSGLCLGKVLVPANPLVRSELTVFLGLAGTALAVAGAVRGFRDPSVRFVACFGGAALVVPFLRPLVQLLLFLPVANLGMPSRWVFVAGFCMAVLAAHGVDEVVRRPGRVPHGMAAVVGFVAGLGVVGAGPFRLRGGAFQETLGGFLLAAAAAAAFRRSRLAGFSLGLAALLVELLPGFLVVNSPADPSPLREVPQVVRLLGDRGHGPWRALGGLRDPSSGPPLANGWTVSTGNNLLALHGVEVVAGYEAAPPAVFVRYWVAAGGAVMGSGRVLVPGDLESRLLDMAGLRYLFWPYEGEPGGKFRLLERHGRMRLYENPAVFPPVRVVGKLRRASDTEEAAKILAGTGFDPSAEAVVEGLGGDEGRPGSVAHRLRRLERGPDRVRLEIEADKDGFLILADTYDSGWRAAVDGRPAEILRADLAFRAVRLPAGRHVVEFRFRPAWVGPGLLVSGLSLAAVLGMALVRRRGAPGGGRA